MAAKKHFNIKIMHVRQQSNAIYPRPTLLSIFNTLYKSRNSRNCLSHLEKLPEENRIKTGWLKWNEIYLGGEERRDGKLDERKCKISSKSISMTRPLIGRNEISYPPLLLLLLLLLFSSSVLDIRFFLPIGKGQTFWNKREKYFIFYFNPEND